MHLRLTPLLRKLSKLPLLALGGLAISIGCTCQSAHSAEFVSFRFNGIQRSISVADIDSFLTSATPPRRLRWYANHLSSEQQTQLRRALQSKLEIDISTMSNLVNSPLGDSFLRHLLPLFWGGIDDEELLKALRSSLVLAAEAEGISAIEIIRHYPLSQLRLDLNVVLTASEEVREMFSNANHLFAAIQASREVVIADLTASSDIFDVRSAQVHGPLEWQRQELTFQNPERDSDEWVIADVYLPTGLDYPAPLIVMSHGVADDRRSFVYLAEHLASHGFSVASLQHPDTDIHRLQHVLQGKADLPDADLFLHRPSDISTVLNILEQKGGEDAEWFGRTDTHAVGLFGHSLGGYTVLAAGGARFDFEYLQDRCRALSEESLSLNFSMLLQCQLLDMEERNQVIEDKRIAAVIAVNPVGSAMFGPSGMANIQLPISLVSGSHDLVTPPVDEQIRPFTWLESEERYLLFVKPASHVSFIDNVPIPISEFPTELIGPNPALAHPMMKWFATSFFDAYINGSTHSESLLSRGYIPTDSDEYEYALTEDFSKTDLDTALGN